MITKITGKLASVTEEQATVVIGSFEYEVLVPDCVRRQLQGKTGENVVLHTLHYLDGNPAHGRVIPRLVGFLNEAEREFFDLFCSVDGLGAKKALRAMVQPVRDIAVSIEEQNAKALSALPGIGPATAERIIAKLRRKMSKFALLVPDKSAYEAEVAHDIVAETFQVLCTLGHTEVDARRLIDTALADKKKFKDVQELLNAIYQKSAKT